MDLTQRGFTHLRTNRGLAAQVHRIASRQMRHNYDKKFDEFKAKLDDAIEQRKSDKAKKFFEAYIKHFPKQEHWLRLTILDEFKLINEIENKEEIEIEMDKKLQKLGKNKDTEETHQALNKFRSDVVSITGPLRQIMEDLIKKEYIQVKTLLVQHGEVVSQKTAEWMKELGIMLKVSKQKKDMKKENHIDHLVESIHLLEESIKKGQTKEGVQKEIFKEDKKIIKSLDDDIKIAFTVILKQTILYMHLLQHFDNIRNTEHKLKDLEFSPTYIKSKIDPFVEKYQTLFKKTHKQMHDMVVELERKGQALAA